MHKLLGSCPRNEPRAFGWAARNDRNRAGRASGMESLDDQLVNLLQAEVAAASAVIVAPVLVFSDFQCSRFVAVVFRHGVLLSKERPAVDAWNSSIFGRPPFSVKKLLMQSQKR